MMKVQRWSLHQRDFQRCKFVAPDWDLSFCLFVFVVIFWLQSFNVVLEEKMLFIFPSSKPVLCSPTRGQHVHIFFFSFMKSIICISSLHMKKCLPLWKHLKLFHWLCQIKPCFTDFYIFFASSTKPSSAEPRLTVATLQGVLKIALADS